MSEIAYAQRCMKKPRPDLNSGSKGAARVHVPLLGQAPEKQISAHTIYSQQRSSDIG
jgi:hypothetical protein